ncbi:MAG: hypothetical protein N3A61_00795 [Ignavibacteria bacterium]|nr:hypothetical protein [Ignavibacteria bacterium]
MVRTKKVKPQDELTRFDPELKRAVRIEYELKCYFEFDETLSKEFFVVELQTFKEFSLYRYNLIIESALKNREITIKLLGITTPDIAFPSYGKASAKIRFEELIGKYLLHIQKQDGNINSFEIYINPQIKEINLVREFSQKKQSKKFIEYLR